MDTQHRDFDQTMVRQFQNGEENCLEQLFQKYLPFMKGQIRQHRFQLLDDDDLLQESRIVLYTAMCCYDVSKKACFFTYFKRLLKNHYVRLLRHYAAQKRQIDTVCITYAECDIGNVEGYGYAQTLDPLDVLVVKESFDAAYDTLTHSEKKSLYGQCHASHSRYIKKHNAYRCETKIRGMIQCK